MNNISKHIQQFSLNFLPMIFSLALMQIFILPDLYASSTLDYVNFNFYLYSALLYIHVFNTVSFNEQVLALKGSSNKDKFRFDLSNFIFFFAVYCLYCVVMFFYFDTNWFIVVFLICLYPIDLAINLLRLIERDKIIGLLLLVQSIVFFALFKLKFFDIFLSYTISNAICFLFFLFFYEKSKFKLTKVTISFSKVRSFFSMSIPTLNRYVDKLFVLVFFSLSFKTSLFPYIAVSGLVMLPITVASKVVIRSIDFDYPLKKMIMLVSVAMPFSVLFIFFFNIAVVNFVYDLSGDVSYFLILGISFFKSLNLIELMFFSLYSNQMDFKSLPMVYSRVLSFILFLALVFGYFYKPLMSDWFLSVLCCYFLLSLVLHLLSINVKEKV